MENLQKRLSELSKQIDQAARRLKLDELAGEVNSLRQQMIQPDFWADRARAEKTIKREAELMKRVEPWQSVKKEAAELVDLLSFDDKKMSVEIEDAVGKLEKKFTELKHDLRFQGPYDDRAAIVSIYAGAGGTDAQDWAEMLLKMYSKWAHEAGYQIKTLSLTPAEEAGIKSAVLEVDGSFTYGKLKGEHGVHRLVRLSPFNADKLRHTSFAKIEVLPKIDHASEISLDESDLKIDVFRASGHGGQSVNTTDSAVRVTHLPTGINVSIQNERSQLQNKETALTILRSRLIQLQMQQHKNKLEEIKGPNQSAEWGNQIRSYVLHPYKLVKDLRTGYESSDPQAVLAGNLDGFINAWLDHDLS